MDYFIIAVTTLAGLYFHGWLYVRIKRWMDRDLALSLAGTTSTNASSCYNVWTAPGRKRSNARNWRPGWNARPPNTAPVKGPGARAATGPV